jgi:hypothetical protein
MKVLKLNNWLVQTWSDIYNFSKIFWALIKDKMASPFGLHWTWYFLDVDSSVNRCMKPKKIKVERHFFVKLGGKVITIIDVIFLFLFTKWQF